MSSSASREASPTVTTGQLSQLPRPARSGGAPCEQVDLKRATETAKKQDDVQTIFFINFVPPNLSGPAEQELIKAKDLVVTWQKWSSTRVEGSVQQAVDAQLLSPRPDQQAQWTRSTYRSMIIDRLFRTTPWAVLRTDQNMARKIQTTTAELHQKLLLAALEGFAVSAAALAQLENVLATISKELVRAGGESSSRNKQYWIMLTRYEHHEAAQQVDPVTRIISFQTTRATYDCCAGKRFTTLVDFDVEFNQYEVGFNGNQWSEVKGEINQSHIDMGASLAEAKTAEITVNV